MSVAAVASAARILNGPYVQNVTPSAITVMWETDSATKGQVEYGLKRSFRQKATGAQRVKIHKIRLKGLKAATAYSYRVGDRYGEFKTAPNRIVPFEFALLGDTRNWGSGEKSTWKRYKFDDHFLQWNIALCLDTGDLVRDGTKYEQWGRDYFPRFERVMRSIPFYPSRGNHERATKTEESKNWFKKYFDLPGGEPYSTFEYADAVFINISYDAMKGAAGFIAKVLSRSRKKWKFVYFHNPVYCTGYAGASNKRKVSGAHNIAPVLERFKVDLVFNGHTHIYERTFSWKQNRRALDNSGVVYVVSGGGVGGQYPDRWTSSMMPAGRWRRPHYQLFRIDGNLLTMTSFAVRKSDGRIVENDFLMLSKDRTLAPKLLRQLKRASAGRAEALIRKLGGLAHVPAARQIVRFLRPGSSQSLRMAAASALERIASAEVVDRLTPYLKDRDPEIRRRVALAVALAQPKDALKKFKTVVLDNRQDSEVRVTLIGAIQLAGEPGAANVLVTLLDNSEVGVRQRAAYALRQLGAPKGPVARAMAQAFMGAKDTYVGECLVRSFNASTGLTLGASKDRRGRKSYKPPKDLSTRQKLVEQWLAKLIAGAG